MRKTLVLFSSSALLAAGMAIAQGSPVIVCYMGLKHLEEICRRLLVNGRPPEEPLAIVASASLPEQRGVETTLGEAAAAAAAAEIAPPTLVVIGEVVRLRAGLDWLGALAGRVLEADPLAQAADRQAG